MQQKNKTETLLRLNKKNFEDEELSHKIFLKTRQKTKLRNIFANKMSTDIKLSKAQISKIIQSGRCLGSWLENVGKKALTNVAISLARDNLPGLVNNLTSSKINKFDNNISIIEATKAGKGFTFFNSNEDTNDIIKIIKSLGDSSVLIYRVIETVKDETKKQEGGFVGAFLTPLASSYKKN